MNALALAGLARLIFAVSEPSPPPPPTPSPVAEIKQQHGPSETPASKPSEQLILGATQSPEPTKPQSDQENNKSASNWSLIFAGIVAGAAAVQVWVMIVQAGHTRRALRVSIEAARAAQHSARMAKKAVELAEHNTAVTERAVILLESIKAEPSLGVTSWHLNPVTILVFTLKNYGATVAHNVTVKGHVSCLGTRNLVLNGAQGVPIAPQGTNQWITKSLISAVPNAQFERLNSMDPNVVTYRVEVAYVDAFGPHHYTQEGQYIAVLKSFVTSSSTSD